MTKPVSAPQSDRPPALEFDNTGHGFGADPLGLFANVNLRVWPGEVVAVRGDNGSGKSTLLRFAVGIGSPRAGRVLVGGQRVRGRDHAPGVGFVGALPQGDGAPPLPPELPVELLTRTALAAWGAAGADAAYARGVFEALRLGAPEVRGKRFGECSKGWQLKVLWFLAVAKPVDLLLLDEPFDGLDDTVKPVAFDLLAQALKRYRPAVLLVSHHYPEIARVADRVFELTGKALRPRGTRPYDVVLTTGGGRVEYRGLTGHELLDVLAEPLLAGRGDLELSATAAGAREEVGPCPGAA